jgi:hypothetical protein
MANAKHGQKICWNLLMSRNLPCIYIYLEYCHIRQNANGKLYMLGNDEIQHFSFHLTMYGEVLTIQTFTNY